MFFAGLSETQRTQLEAQMQQRLYNAGDVVFHAGDASDCLLLVMFGSAGVIVRTDQQHDVRLTSVRRGGVIGEVGFLDGAQRSATVVAQEKLLVNVLTRSAFDSLRATAPDTVYQLMVNLTLDLASRLRHTNKLAMAQRASLSA
jgi:SulP family sulfate permease